MNPIPVQVKCGTSLFFTGQSLPFHDIKSRIQREFNVSFPFGAFIFGSYRLRNNEVAHGIACLIDGPVGPFIHIPDNQYISLLSLFMRDFIHFSTDEDFEDENLSLELEHVLFHLTKELQRVGLAGFKTENVMAH